ncbi:hypothetical protein ACJX0J_005355, partial [Zea mays]
NDDNESLAALLGSVVVLGPKSDLSLFFIDGGKKRQAPKNKKGYEKEHTFYATTF